MADVFISYHEKSAGEIAAHIAAALESNGVSCWYAKRDIPPGGDFARYIPPQIGACKVFLLILNDNVVHQSKHIESEVGLAFSRLNKKEDITILPLEFGGFKRDGWLQYYLIHAQSVKISSWDETALRELKMRISLLLGRSSKPEPSLDPPPRKITQEGPCGDNATYSFDENGLLIISGTGAMWDYDWNIKTGTANTPWWDIRAKIFHVIIVSGITSMAKYAFCNCMNLTGVDIPESVTRIAVGAFDNCIRLSSVTIPNRVMKLETGVFNGCSALSDIQIPYSVTKIEFGAFKDCKSLTNLTIPDSVKKIELGSFSGCTSLNIVSVAAKTSINFFAFPENVVIRRRK